MDKGPKLYRRIAHEGINILPKTYDYFNVNNKSISLIHERIKQSMVFDMSLVLDKIFPNKLQLVPDNLLPPFRSFWMEYDRCYQGKQYLTGNLVTVGMPDDDEIYHYTVLSFDDGVGMDCVYRFSVNKDGEYIRQSFGGREFRGVESAYIFVYGHIADLTRCIAFLNIKNIVCEPRDFVSRDNKRMVQRFGANQGGYRYHILTVKKPGSSGGGNGDRKTISGGDGNSIPLHAVRGHIRHYTENPMFGKLFGSFFIPAHIRGDIKNGIVDKDYRIEKS